MAGNQLSIPKVSTEQVKAARALLRWSQSDLAKAANISIPTIKRLEANAGDLGGMPATIIAICAALESAGIEFIPENGGGAGVRLKGRSNAD
ncbi:helix-turn-helix transcriptional regulator [uncultured Roseovarius sp.]|uniref:helix-turn-helix domain-containing protein n=1 Tax=uncultured Roseovarius sp. TaxID=293344 RepID=UPI00261BA697|nr:helix-turn-helix transcriptional regulator [uncultured Roseovarius sp.]